MPTGNFDSPPPDQAGADSLKVPARYYSDSSLNSRPPLVPRGLVLGCGGVSFLLLAVMVIGSAAMTSGAIGEMFDLSLSMMQSEAQRMYAGDVTKEQRAAFEREVKEMRRMIREGKISPVKVEPFLQDLREASSDKLLKSDEVLRLTRSAHDLQSAPRPAVRR